MNGKTILKANFELFVDKSVEKMCFFLLMVKTFDHPQKEKPSFLHAGCDLEERMPLERDSSLLGLSFRLMMMRGLKGFCLHVIFLQMELFLTPLCELATVSRALS